MKDSVFFTIVAGVSVFVIGQFILKFILDPIIAFKESLGSLSAFCLRYRAKITNAHATQECHDELASIISTILSKQEAIPLYAVSARLFNLPSKRAVLKSCQLLNGISYNMLNDRPKNSTTIDTPLTILMDLEQVSNLLKIRLDYSSLQ